VRPYLKKKSLHKKIGLVEWLKVKALIQAPVPQKKKKVSIRAEDHLHLDSGTLSSRAVCVCHP
jgi:hypothetical protein